eukprot:Hpha_TRINITY_DN407_c0_g1::TRINITY_DN407_c0_g1_i1::g.27567::m.27567
MGSKIVRERHLATCGSTHSQVDESPAWAAKGDYGTPCVRTARCAGNETLVLPRGTVAAVLVASFQRGGRSNDVTRRVRESLYLGGLEFRAQSSLCDEPVAARRRLRGELLVRYTVAGRAPVQVGGTRKQELDGTYRPVGEAGGSTLYQREDGASLFRVRQAEWEGRWGIARRGTGEPALVSPFQGALTPDVSSLVECKVVKAAQVWASEGEPLWHDGGDEAEMEVNVGNSAAAAAALAASLPLSGSPSDAASGLSSSKAPESVAREAVLTSPTLIKVVSGSRAHDAGLRAGMKLQRVAGVDVATLRDAESALRAAPTGFSALLSAHWVDLSREGRTRYRRLSVESTHRPADDYAWAEEKMRERQARSAAQADMVKGLSASRQDNINTGTEPGSFRGTMAPSQLMDAIFPPRPNQGDLRRRYGVNTPDPPKEESERWLQMIRDGSSDEAVIWLYCSVDLRETSKTKTADERLQRAGARCRRSVDKMLIARGHTPLVREWHAEADLSRVPTSRREVRSMVRSKQRYGVLMDILATRRYIWSGEPHKVASDVYSYLGEYYPVAVKFVLVGITDNASKRVARDMFCRDRLPPEQGGPERFMSSSQSKTSEAGKFSKNAAPPPMDGIDNEHQYLVFPASDWERCEIVKRGERWREDKERQRHERYFTPKFVSPEGGYEPPPEWVQRLDQKRQDAEERRLAEEDEKRRRLIQHVSERRAITPDPEIGKPPFMRSTASSERQRTVAPQAPSPRHLLVEPKTLTQHRPKSSSPTRTVEWMESCPRCWTHACQPRPHGLLMTVAGSETPPESEREEEPAAVQGRESIYSAAEVVALIQRATVGHDAKGLSVDIPGESAPSPPTVKQGGVRSPIMGGLASPGPASRRASRRGSARRRSTRVRDDVLDAASGQAKEALEKLDVADRKLRKLSRHYQQAIRERRHEELLREQAEHGGEPWHQRTFRQVASSTTFSQRSPAAMPSPSHHLRPKGAPRAPPR